MRLAVAEHGETRHAAENRSEIFEKGAEERHDLARGNVQRPADGIAVLRRFLVRVERVGEKLESGHFVGDRQPERPKRFDPSKTRKNIRSESFQRHPHGIEM